MFELTEEEFQAKKRSLFERRKEARTIKARLQKTSLRQILDIRRTI